MVAAMTAADWDCEAYGPEGREHDALCFFADAGQRGCLTQAVCRQLMAYERQRLFRRMNEMAAHGNETAAFLAEEFARPEQILGGGDS
jgi:hypothetical protein